MAVISPCCLDTQKQDARRRQRVIKKSVAASTFRLIVRAVIEFNRRDNASCPWVVENKIHVLLAHSSALRLIPQVVGTFQDVCQAGLD